MPWLNLAFLAAWLAIGGYAFLVSGDIVHKYVTAPLAVVMCVRYFARLVLEKPEKGQKAGKGAGKGQA
jgi:hypothetical protein